MVTTGGKRMINNIKAEISLFFYNTKIFFKFIFVMLTLIFTDIVSLLVGLFSSEARNFYADKLYNRLFNQESDTGNEE